MRRTRIISAVGHRRITCQLYAVGNQKQKQNRRSHRISLTSLCQDGRKHFKYNKVHGIEDSDAEGLVHCERGERLLRFRESLAYFGPMGDPSQEIVPRVQGWSFETQAHHHKGERPDRVPSKGGARRVREQSLREHVADGTHHGRRNTFRHEWPFFAEDHVLVHGALERGLDKTFVIGFYRDGCGLDQGRYTSGDGRRRARARCCDRLHSRCHESTRTAANAG